MGVNTSNTDQPIDPEGNDKDLLNIAPYIYGLSDYIRNCSTPMTIAIQGDWGTGKTSMMNMIRHNIASKNDASSKIYTIWFNTWQYSQFNMSENLPVSLLSYLIKKVCTENKNGERMKSLLDTLNKWTLFGIKAGLSVAGIDHNGILPFENDMKSNFAEELETLKDDFESAVNDLLVTNKKDRLVVFIDDLDRLNPEIAVEVLEVLKVFLDVKNCIYVLAVDYDVVTQGIEKKFGGNVAKVKGKSFFDKIIQLPFKMPVQLFQLDEFLKEQLSYYNITNSADILHFEKLIRISIGPNPRTMKRLFNSFQLIINVIHYDANEKFDEYKCELLFAVLCMQMAFEPLYEYFMETNEWLNDSENNIFNQSPEDVLARLSEADDDSLNLKYANSVTNFLEILSGVISANEELKSNQLPSDVNLEVFKEVLRFSSITNTSTGSSGNKIVDITIDDDVSQYNIIEVCYKENDSNAKSNVKSFTAAFVWLLEKIGENSQHREKFREVINNIKDFDIPERFLKAEEIRQKYPSAVKSINNLDNVEVVTHYSSKDLKNILIKLLVALNINTDNVSFRGERK